ncbi:MAG: enoyl-CoA hydratase-related protein [Gammaproteobacteria bacterium]
MAPLNESFETHLAGSVLRLSLNGRTRLNVVNGDLLRHVAARLRALGKVPGLRCVLFESPGADAWIGGADLRELGSLTPDSAEAFIRSIHEVCAALRALPVPVVASIRGHCLGAGLEIAAACDFRLADTTAVFGMPEVRVGVPSVIEAALLPTLIGWGRTRELVYRGHLVDARTAHAIGLVEHCVAPDELAGLVAHVIDDLLQGAPRAIANQKSLVQSWESATLPEAIEAGVRAFVDAYATDEPATYVARFFARRA